MSTATSLHPSVMGLQNRKGANGSASPYDSGVSTPEETASGGFTPNAPASAVRSEEVTLQTLLYESGAGDGKTGTVDDWPIPDDLDFTRPVSELLRKGTARAHMSAEHSKGAVALTNGQLELKEYVKWLGLLWRVYDALETGLEAYSTNPVLAPTYNPALLQRAPELAKDIQFLLGRLPADNTPCPAPAQQVKSTPLPPFPLPAWLLEVFTNTPPVLAVYLDRLRDLSVSQETAPRLLAHAYVRYLGDLSGGQIIGARLRKAYGLERLDGRHFYYFDLNHDTEAAEAGEETVGERKKKLHAVKGWYRDGMDAGAGDDAELKAALVKEANLAFVLNTHLFSLITPPAPKEPELRYYEKRALKHAAEEAARPPKTLADHIIALVYIIGSVLLGMFLFHIVWPLAGPHVVEYGTPVWQQYGAPWFYGSFMPWWNESLIPWWDHHAAPIFARQLASSRRVLI